MTIEIKELAITKHFIDRLIGRSQNKIDDILDFLEDVAIQILKINEIYVESCYLNDKNQRICKGKIPIYYKGSYIGFIPFSINLDEKRMYLPTFINSKFKRSRYTENLRINLKEVLTRRPEWAPRYNSSKKRYLDFEDAKNYLTIFINYILNGRKGIGKIERSYRPRIRVQYR